MNLLYIKYLIFIAGILGTTMIVSTPLTPYALTSPPHHEGEITAESMIQFGSETFYSELEKPGNEYLRQGVAGYSRDLLPTKEQEQKFNSAWKSGIISFKAGYTGCIEAFYLLLTIPQMKSRQEKTKVCDRFRQAKDDLRDSITAFTAAKASVSPASSLGFTIGMVLPRISAIEMQSEDAEISCIKAVIADRDNDGTGFEQNMRDVESSIREMRRLYPELKALNNDFGNATAG